MAWQQSTNLGARAEYSLPSNVLMRALRTAPSSSFASSSTTLAWAERWRWGEWRISSRYLVAKRVGGLNCHLLVEKCRESPIRGPRPAAPIVQSAGSYL